MVVAAGGDLTEGRSNLDTTRAESVYVNTCFETMFELSVGRRYFEVALEVSSNCPTYKSPYSGVGFVPSKV